MKREGTTYFRPHAAVNISGLWVWLLGAFDVGLIGYLIVQVWRL